MLDWVFTVIVSLKAGQQGGHGWNYLLAQGEGKNAAI